MSIDWSRSFLRPVELTRTENHVLRCVETGESVSFSGDLLRLITESGAEATDITVKQAAADGFLTLEGTAVFPGESKITGVEWFAGRWSGVREICVASTRLADIGVFLRTENTSFFLSLDFPYSKVCGTAVTYPPYDTVPGGEPYEVHSLSVGAAVLTGSTVGNYDRAEIEAMSEYISKRNPTRFDRAIFSTTCITNRMTDVREGRIFYSMYDNPTMTLDSETIKREMLICAELGIEYYQLFEGYFDWEGDGSTAKNAAELVDFAREHGIRAGDYVHPGDLYCPHYNYHHRHLDKDEWRALWDDDGEKVRGQLCFGCDEFVDFISDRLVSSITELGEEFICLDMLGINRCYDTSHGHGEGDLYRQIRGLVRFMERLNETSANFIVWTNSGVWLEFMPKLLWYNPNVYLTDPHARSYESMLNMLKYYGDCRREQMVSVHNQYFVPYQYYTNCEYYAFRHSRVEDLQFFEYSFLQGLAVTPNICLGELRTFLERIPASKVDYCKAFMKKWMDFCRENFQIWKRTIQLGDSPDAGANEAYAHISGDRGWICLVNQNHYTNRFPLRLDSSIGLDPADGARFLLTEEYPGTCPIAEQPLPGPMYGDELTLSVEPFSVRFIRVERYSPAESGIRLYGVDGCLRIAEDGGFVFDVSALSGLEIPAAVVVENGLGSAGITAETVPTVPMYTFPSEVRGVTRSGNCARFTLAMPRDAFVREIPLWNADGSEAVSLRPETSDFVGGYLHNHYRENQHVTLSVKTASASTGQMPALIPAAACGAQPSYRRHASYRTELDIPFIEWPAMGLCYGYDQVIELIFTDCRLVKSLTAKIDGNPVPVLIYKYPPSKMWTYYIELTGEVKSGTKPVLELFVEWNDSIPQDEPAPVKKKKETFVVGQ